MNGFSLSLIYPTAADAKQVFDAMAQGGKVNMPLQKTFWAESFGMLVDKFGTPWMVSGPEVEEVRDRCSRLEGHATRDRAHAPPVSAGRFLRAIVVR